MVKVISLSDRAYMELKASKGPGNSFSDTILKLLGREKKVRLSSLAGTWPGSKEELDRIAKELEEERKKFKLREVDFDVLH